MNCFITNNIIYTQHNTAHTTMDSYSASLNRNAMALNVNIPEMCKSDKVTWEMNALERSECLSDDITVIAYFMLFIFYIFLFSSLDLENNRR